jgi:tRNA U34 5-carboxymethylaminomethyl modifying GTPase MnmE/TrmE
MWEEQLSLDGIPLRPVRYAGLRETEDEAERIGVQRARDALERADVAVVLLDDSEPLSQEDFDILAATADTPRILLYTKTDLPGVWGRLRSPRWRRPRRSCCLSAPAPARGLIRCATAYAPRGAY